MARQASASGPSRHKLTFETLEPRHVPSGFVVTSLADAGPGTLRDAITQANASPGADTIDFSKTGAIKLLSNLPAITDDLSITAAKPVTVNGQNKFSLFAVTGDGTDADFVGLALVNGMSASGGAAFFIDAPNGTVDVTRTNISRMFAVGPDVAGGAISIQHGAVTLMRFHADARDGQRHRRSQGWSDLQRRHPHRRGGQQDHEEPGHRRDGPGGRYLQPRPADVDECVRGLEQGGGR